MTLAGYLKEEMIVIGMEAEDKEACIRTLAGRLTQLGVVEDESAFCEEVLQRERIGSTGIGFGIAIPHGKCSAVTKAAIAFARPDKPLEWQSLDGEPVTMVFLLAVPETSASNEHLQILAMLSRKLMHEEFRSSLMAAKTRQDVMDVLYQTEAS